MATRICVGILTPAEGTSTVHTHNFFIDWFSKFFIQDWQQAVRKKRLKIFFGIGKLNACSDLRLDFFIKKICLIYIIISISVNIDK